GVQVDRVVHVPWEAADDVRRGVVRKDRLSRAVEDVEDVVDGLELEAVAGAEALVGRLDRELVAASRIPLLVEVQALEARCDGGVRLRLLAAVHGNAVPGARGETAVDDRPRIWPWTRVSTGFARELDAETSVRRCKRARLGRAGPRKRNQLRPAGGGRPSYDDGHGGAQSERNQQPQRPASHPRNPSHYRLGGQGIRSRQPRSPLTRGRTLSRAI